MPRLLSDNEIYRIRSLLNMLRYKDVTEEERRLTAISLQDIIDHAHHVTTPQETKTDGHT